MPNKKKKIFTKENSVKFLLLHGNSKATNAEGETLQNIFVPVSKNYKPGTSLLMSSIAAISNQDPVEDAEKEPDLEKIMEGFGDSDSEDGEIKNLPSKIKTLTLTSKEKNPQFEAQFSDNDNSDYYDGDNQFSDATDDSFDEDFKHEAPIDYGNCPENVKIFNARFEKVFEEYDEEEIGPLDDDEIGGNLTTDCDRVKNLLDSEFNHEEDVIVLGPCDEHMKERILTYAEDSDEEEIVEIFTEKPLDFDCESILSTYSNKYNHPTLIKAREEKDRKVTKIRIPYNPLKKNLTKTQLKALNEDENESDEESDDNLTVESKMYVRVKGETPEQRRERKNLFKEAKRESRILKKENKLAFKREKKIQKSQSLNIQRTAGIKLL